MPPSIPASASAELAPITSVPFRERERLATPGTVFGSWTGRIGLVLTSLMLATSILGPVLAPENPFALVAAPLLPPSRGYPLGTDALGRDLLSGVLYGARTSMVVAGAAAVIALLCGVTIGLVAGYRGRWVDDLLMRITEIFQVIPRFFLVVVAVALFGPGLDRLIVTLGLTSWPVIARVVRGEVFAMRELEFVYAAEAAGASPARILWHELAPNVIPSTLVVAGLMFSQTLLVEASIGFLGLGDPNAMSWGMLAGQAQSFLRVAWWLPLFPGLAITAAVLGTNLLADALASALRGR